MLVRLGIRLRILAKEYLGSLKAMFMLINYNNNNYNYNNYNNYNNHTNNNNINNYNINNRYPD